MVSFLSFPALPVFSAVSYDQQYQPYESDDYLDAIKDGALQRVFEMFLEDQRNKLLDIIQDPDKRKELYAKLAAKAGKKLEDILNNNSTTDGEKAEAVLNLISESVLEYKNGPAGGLDLTVQYSPEYMTAWLEWQRKLEVLRCNEWQIKLVCDSWGENCGYTGSYKKVNYAVEPDYRVYRLVDGHKELVTTLKGKTSFSHISFSTEGADWAKIIWRSISGDDSPEKIDKAILADYDADIREPGTSLAYLVEADSYRFWRKSSIDQAHCKAASNWESEVEFDSDRDGYADFVPGYEYVRHNYAGIMPAINLLLLN